MPINELTFEDFNQLKTLQTMLKDPLPQTMEEQTTILVIGNAGAGKSSTVKMLLDEKAAHQPDIGIRVGKSQTALPDIFVDKEDPNLLYCDTHGFEDTRPNKKAALSLLMQSVAHNNKIKGLLIMIDARSFSDKALALLKLVATLHHLLKDDERIEEACVFGITRVAPEPALGSAPNRESIHSLESLNNVLEDLRQGIQEDLDEEMALLKSNPLHQGALSKQAHDLICKNGIISLLIKALQANRVVLVYDTSDKKAQVREKLRHQFNLLSTKSAINHALNFEAYDSDREQFLQRILKQSTLFLNTLEHEDTQIKQHYYLSHSDTLESSERRLIELNEDARQKEIELSSIDRRETAPEPYWTESKSIAPTEYQSSESDEGGALGIGKVTFSYRANAPISRVELIGGRRFNYLKTFWNTEEPLGKNLTRLFILAPMRVLTFGLADLYILGAPAMLDHYEFTHMTLNGKNTYINREDWEADIALADQRQRSVFSVECHSTTIAGLDCHDREPNVKLYVPICYMVGNPERIANLKHLLVALKKQVQDIETVINLSKEAIEKTDISDDIQERLSRNKQLLLEQSAVDLETFADQIERQRELMALIYDVFNALHIPLHESIIKFMRLWDERESKLLSIKAPPARSPDAVVGATQRILSTSFRNSLFAVFRQNLSFSVEQLDQELTIQMSPPSEGYHATFFNDAKQKFEQSLSKKTDYVLTKHSEEQWSVKGSASSIFQLREDLELIANEKRLSNRRKACTIS